MPSNLSSVFGTSVKINQTDLFDRDSVWPQNVEVCVTRVPIRKRDGYSDEFIKNFSQRLKASMAQNGLVFLVCYAPTEAKFRPFEVAKAMVDAGFNHIDNIVIEKTWLPGKRAENMLVNSHEYVLFFCNGNIWKIDRQPIKKYLMLEDSAPCIGNTWLVETGSLDEAYSEDLAELILRMASCLPGSSVFDPFMGTSASLKACLKLGHSLTGFETDQRKIAQYKKVIDDYRKKGALA
jgi:DNA modification methylase